VYEATHPSFAAATAVAGRGASSSPRLRAADARLQRPRAPARHAQHALASASASSPSPSSRSREDFVRRSRKRSCCRSVSLRPSAPVRRRRGQSGALARSERPPSVTGGSPIASSSSLSSALEDEDSLSSDASSPMAAPATTSFAVRRAPQQPARRAGRLARARLPHRFRRLLRHLRICRRCLVGILDGLGDIQRLNTCRGRVNLKARPGATHADAPSCFLRSLARAPPLATAPLCGACAWPWLWVVGGGSGAVAAGWLGGTDGLPCSHTGRRRGF
jgi:hypothetical protein